ncbi:MAG: hypothetical protein H0X24_21490 [Ktedonobacterales bacterium]|nr:hypothetical protein [Ktedonobacterales bacterium]
MRNLTRRPLTLALSVLLLSVLGAYGLGLTHGHARPSDSSPLGLLRNACTPHHAVCGQLVPGMLGATLLIGMARVRDGLGATTALVVQESAPPSAAPQATDAAPPAPATTLLGLVALVLACCWLAFPTRITRIAVVAHPLPTRSIPAHLCTPAP